jgi:hypothetical protein
MQRHAKAAALTRASDSADRVTHSLAHSPTHPLTHSLAHSPTHPLTHSLAHSLTCSLAHSLARSLARSLALSGIGSDRSSGPPLSLYA